MKPAVSFPGLLQKFFIERLMQQRHVSPHTISSYRDTFKLLLQFAHGHLHKPPDRLTFEDIDATLISAFLNDLERNRGICARTRNLRLTAIRSFFRYAAYEAPMYAAQIQRVLAMQGKRFTPARINFLSHEEMQALLAAPDQRTWGGRRDYALMLLAADTGLRVSEITRLRRPDVTLGAGGHVDVIGKGRKQRATPFSKRTAAVLKSWLKEPANADKDAIFPSARGGGHLSSDAVQRLLKKHTAVACKSCPSLGKKRVSPHVLRHTSGSELLMAGLDQATIALWLGHESPQTTQMYLDASVEWKEKILAKVKPHGGKPGRYRPDNPLLEFLKGL